MSLLILFLLISVVMCFFAPSEMNMAYMSTCIAIALGAFITFIKVCNDDPNGLKKIYLRHSIYFIICYFIVFYQCDIDYLLGLADLSDSYLWYDVNVVSKALALSNMGLCSIFVGYTYNMKFTRISFKDYNTTRYDYRYPNKTLLVYIAIILLVLYYILIPKDFLNNGYARGYDLEAGPVSMIMGYLVSVFVAILVLYSVEYKSCTQKSWLNTMKFPLAVISVYILLIIMTGRRTEAIRMTVMLLISYLYCKNGKVNYTRLGVFGIIGILAFSLVGVLRDMEAGTVGSGFAALSKNSSIIPFTKEIAGSVNTLFIAMSHFPDYIDYTYGLTFFPGFLKLIPGLSSLYINYIMPAGADYNSDTLITHLYFGGDAIWGVGSSINADIYISFGPIGVIIVMMLLGYFLRYLEVGTFCQEKSLYFIALSFGCYSQFIYVCRQSIPDMFLSWTYGCIIIYFITKKKIRVQ